MEPTPSPSELRQAIARVLTLFDRVLSAEQNTERRAELESARASIKEAEDAFFPAYEREMAANEAKLAQARQQIEASLQQLQAPPPIPEAPAKPPFVPLPGARLREEILRRYIVPEASASPTPPPSDDSVRELDSEAWDDKRPRPARSSPPRPAPTRATTPVRPPQPARPASPPKKAGSSEIGDDGLSEMFRDEDNQ